MKVYEEKSVLTAVADVLDQCLCITTYMYICAGVSLWMAHQCCSSSRLVPLFSMHHSSVGRIIAINLILAGVGPVPIPTNGLACTPKSASRGAAERPSGPKTSVNTSHAAKRAIG